MKAKVWYLYHSGFAVQTSEHFLVFDYWKEKPKGKGLESGVIDPMALAEQDVIVFASHRHGDHYNRSILSWRQTIPKIRLVLSDDIPAVREAYMVKPGMQLSLDDLTIDTLASNDEGVAFVVEVDGLCIYHAGDLNWWHWEGEPDDYNEGMAASYKSQIALMKERRIDLAFVPVDPRLEQQYSWGIDHIMQTLDVQNVVPMHFGKAGYIVERLLNDDVSERYRHKIISLVERGAFAEI